MECILFPNNYVNLSVLGKWKSLDVSFIVPNNTRENFKKKKINGTALETGLYMV